MNVLRLAISETATTMAADRTNLSSRYMRASGEPRLMQVISSITLAALMHGIAAAAPSATPPAGAASEAGALSVDARITLPDANGRIDHLAFDPSRQRLYVAELGSDSVAIV